MVEIKLKITTHEIKMVFMLKNVGKGLEGLRSLEWKTITSKKTFILACRNGLTGIVAMMLEMAQEVKIDLNAKDDMKNSKFHSNRD